ncbi:timeless protein-domain-containing protein [Kalaharituber pfeilii]|nr:timeless protein-domain-containing protein [Kalaharituber pfeilii]
MESPEVEEYVQDTVDPMIRAHIHSLCSALGGSHASETGQYVLGDEAFACLRDLKRWLKGYDEKLNRLDVARVMAECQLVTGDLLEIIASWKEEDVEVRTKFKIALACIELLVPLTWPLDKNPATMTVNHHKHLPVLEYAQMAYKNGLLHHRSGAVLKGCVRACLPSVALAPKERTERDDGIIKLVLYLFRNIATIEHPCPTETDTGEEISRSATIEVFYEQNIFDFLLAVASGMGEEFNTQDTVVMEILYHLLKGVNIEQLFMTDKEQTKKASSKLENLLDMEKRLRTKNVRAQSTRHSRFGTTLWVQKQDGMRVTVSGQDVLADKSKGLEKMNETKKWKRPKYRGGISKSLAVNDFDMTLSLKGSSKRILREFVEQFLDAGFNPLFSHIRRAVEREAERVLQQSHPRQFFYLISWFLAAERMRRKVKPTVEVDADSDLSFALIAGVLNQETLILLQKSMMEWYDLKQWVDLEAAMRCMIQLLLTVQDMALSPLEEDQEIAENMQNRIFYEESTLELILSILRTYKAQPFGYLDACTELAHVHLRVLERYSKQNTYIFIKAKRQKTKRNKANSNANTVDGEPDETGDGNISESDEELNAENSRVTRERAFNFIKYETKFMSNSAVDTFLKFLAYYNELEYAQMKRAISFLHRVFVKRELEAVLFRIDVLELLNRMMKGKEALPVTHPAYKEVDQFTRYYIKQLVRKLQKTPALYVELLFTKTNRTHYFIQYGHDEQPKTRKPRAPVELEVSPKLSYSEQVGVAVSVLINENKDDTIDWVKKVLNSAINERQAWESETTARRMEEVTLEGEEAPVDALKPPEGAAPPFVLSPDTDERKATLSQDSKVMLLLRILGFKPSTIDDDKLKWELPGSITAAALRDHLALLKKYTDEPPTYEDGKTAEDFLRRKARPRANRLESSDDEDEDEDDGIDHSRSDDEHLFGPNVLKPRKSKKDKKKKLRRRRRRSDEEPEDEETLRKKEEDAEKKLAAKKKRDDEKRRQIKSAVYINDSDEEEDEERDRLFFEKERAMRLKMGTEIDKELGMPAEEAVLGTKKRKGGEEEGRRKKRRKGKGEESGEDDGDGESDKENGGEKPKSLFISDNSDEEMADAAADAEAAAPDSEPETEPVEMNDSDMETNFARFSKYSATSFMSRPSHTSSKASTRLLGSGSDSETEKDEDEDDQELAMNKSLSRSRSHGEGEGEGEQEEKEREQDIENQENEAPRQEVVRGRKRMAVVDSDEE